MWYSSCKIQPATKESIRSLLWIPASKRQNQALISTISGKIRNKIDQPIQENKKINKRKRRTWCNRQRQKTIKEKGGSFCLSGFSSATSSSSSFFIWLLHLFFLIRLNFRAEYWKSQKEEHLDLHMLYRLNQWKQRILVKVPTHVPNRKN